MGYRVRLGRIAKSEREKYKGKSYEECSKLYGDKYDCFPSYRLPEHEELFEIGKYWDFKHETGETEKLEGFYDFDVYKECESEFYIMSKPQLLKIIDWYHDKIYLYFQDLYDGKEDPQVYFASKVNEWKDKKWTKPYWLDEEHSDGEVVRSWKYEYAIFNITHIYRTFDWENDYLIYSGW